MNKQASGVGYDPLAVPVKMRVSAASARHLKDLGIETVEDALHYAPRRYYQWGTLTRLDDLVEGDDATVMAKIVGQRLIKNRSGNGVRLLVDITDGTATLTCTFFAGKEYALSRHRRLLQQGETFLFAGKVNSYNNHRQLVQPTFEEIADDSHEAAQRKRGRPIPIYPAKSSLPSWKISALLEQIFHDFNWQILKDVLPENVRQSAGLISMADAYRLLHFPEEDIDWQTAIRTLAWNEAFVLQAALLQPRYESAAQGKNQSLALRSPSVSSGPSLVEKVLSQLSFELTDGQKKAWEVIEADLARQEPMQRLLQADVGAGKTVVALLAMLRAVEAGKQAALLAPTEVLASQHLISLQKLLGDLHLDVPMHLLTASQSSTTKNEVLLRLSAGEPGIVVGTHALLQDRVQLPNLGLLVVDEQHRFGVEQREKLREGREMIPHLLVMTATPIPRTIAMTVFGDLDVTAMTDIPQGRTPVKTYRVDESKTVWMERLWNRVREEIDNGGRVYVVCPRIDEADIMEGSSENYRTLPSIEQMLPLLRSKEPLAGIEIGVAHGQQSSAENAASIANFVAGKSPVLLATTVIEVGIDVPEATMMIIMGATQFGLSQLHQLRGRVGRSNRPSVCMLVHSAELSSVADERLQALVENTDGFALAEVDLRLRREGDVLGQKQSGVKSSLQFLSVRRDAAIIQGARRAVELLVGSDPLLEQCLPLREAIRKRTGDNLVWLERN